MPWLAAAIILHASSVKILAAGAYCAKAKIDVFGNVVLGQRFEMKVRRHPLRKLEKLRAAKQILQLRLTNKDQLQKLIFIDIDIGQHSEGFRGRPRLDFAPRRRSISCGGDCDIGRTGNPESA